MMKSITLLANSSLEFALHTETLEDWVRPSLSDGITCTAGEEG